MKKWIVSLACGLFLPGLIFSGIGYGQPTKVVVGNVTADEIHVPYYMALKNGYFEQAGLQLERKTYVTGPNLMMSMTNGELQMNVGTGYTPMLQAAAQGADIKILVSMVKGNGPVVARAHIKTFKDLDGKIVGSPGLGTIQNTMLSMAAQKYGVKFKKVLHGKITDLPVFLEKGEIDAFAGWGWVAADAMVKIKGAHLVLKLPVIPNMEAGAMGVHGKFYREHPATVKKFLSAYLKGVKYYRDNKQQAAPFLAGMINRPVEVGKMALEGAIPDLPEIDIPSVKFSVQDAIDTGKIKKEAVPDTDAFVRKYIDQTLYLEMKKEYGL